MSKEINFKQAFISIYTNQNIKISDIDNKNNTTLQSIFKLFDENNDSEIDTKELQKIIARIDENGDESISKDEIEKFSKNNNINKNSLNKFIEQIYEILPKVESATTKSGGTPERKEIIAGQLDMNYSLTTTKHGQYEKYTSTTKINYFENEPYKNSAIYDNKNDSLLPINKKNNFEIKGIENFIKNKNSANPPYPKLIITDENGKKTYIEIKMNLNLNVNNPETYYKVLLTDLTNAISELEPNVLKDLSENITQIDIQKGLDASSSSKESTSGKFIRRNENSNPYQEIIQLDFITGFKDLKEVLTHEIGHAVDGNVKDFGTNVKEKELNSFINKLKNLPEFKNTNIYALKNVQELYAEYYAYKNGGSFKAETNNLFKKLEENPDKYNWNEIKNILDDIENVSNNLTNDFAKQEKARAQKETDMLNFISELNNKESNEKKVLLKSISNEELYDEIYKHISPEQIESILKKYPSLKIKWDNSNNKEQFGEILRTLRNDSDLKDSFTSAINKIGEGKRFFNLNYTEALIELEKRTTNSSSQPMKKEILSKKIDNFGLDKLISKTGFQEAIIAISERTDSVPESVRERCLNGPIDKDFILRLRNQDEMFYFLAFESGLYQTK